MSGTNEPARDSRDYVRFILLSGPRTGSNLLASSLNSNPSITCFREVFNFEHDFVQFDVQGYDNVSSRDLSWRKSDPVGFLEERIFGRHPPAVRAVGFKFHYPQFWGFPGLLERLTEDGALRVLHLRRQNLLRMLVSLKLAQATGVFMEDTRPGLTPSAVIRAARHPLRAAGRLGRRLRKPRSSPSSPSPSVTVSPEELFDFVVRTNQSAARFDNLFRRNPALTLFYEDMVDRRDEVFAEAQSFLGVEPRPLAVTMRRQNPEPLRALIGNYNELREAFADTPQAAFFD